ncbi:MAG: hypothetical protein ACI83O_000474 [Patescibacteria group bacterium]
MHRTLLLARPNVTCVFLHLEHLIFMNFPEPFDFAIETYEILSLKVFGWGYFSASRTVFISSSVVCSSFWQCFMSSVPF